MMSTKFKTNQILKLILVLFFLIIPKSTFANIQNEEDAKWIWQSENGPKNTWMAFRKTINVSTVPSEAIIKIAVDTKYWLWINGNMVIFEGGLARGAAPNTVYYDPVDLAPYLKEGENTIAILVWYWGNTHKTHEDSGKGGLCVLSEEIPELNTNTSWKMKVHPAYDPLSGGVSNKNRVQAYNVKFDARKAMRDWSDNSWYSPEYDDAGWNVPVEKGGVDSEPWGTWVARAIPQWKDRGLTDYTSLKIGGNSITLPYTNTGSSSVIISAKLPYNKQITPFLKVNSAEGKSIVMDTDNSWNLIKGTYITKAGTQEFESYSWFNGHNVEYTIPAGVEVLELKYRWTGVGEMTGTFETNDDFYNRLWWMARNTLYICARDGYMDCPDRERGLWIGDVADQAGAIFYTLDEPGRLLLKKAIDNTIEYRDGNIIQGLAPGFGAYRGESSELASQSLQFITQGIWQYYYNTGDKSTLANAYPAILDYLKIWNMQTNGLPEYRKGFANWVDWGEKPDVHATVAIWYYMALKTAKNMAVALEKDADIAWYNGRINSIESAFEEVYWRGTHYGTAGRPVEERATALAVLSGLAKPEHYKIIAENNLFPVREASPHMEWMVEEALILMGYTDKALLRMKERYEGQVNQTNLTTLYEKFTANGEGSGTPNHAWNAPNYILSRYITGIKATELAWESYEVCPNLAHLKSFKTNVPSVKGDISVDVNASKTNFNLKLKSPENTTAVVGIPKKNTEIFEVKVGGVTVWKDNAFVDNVSGISFNSEDESFLKFNVVPGTWEFNADILADFVPEISFKSPNNNTEINKGYAELNIELNVSDDEGIEKVELYLDQELIATKTEGPFNFYSANVSELSELSRGDYIVKAVVTDTDNKTAEATINIRVIDKSDIFVNRLLFYLPLNGDGLDESGKGNHAKLGSAVTFAPAKYGDGAAFKYVEGSYFTSANDVFEYSAQNAYTIAFWLKVSDYSTRGDIIQPNVGRTLLYSNGTDLSFRSSHQRKTISFNLDENEKDDWFHLALVIDQRDGQRQHKFYINGEPRGSIAENYDFETDKPKAKGELIFGAFSNTRLLRNFTGMLDEIYLFNEILSADEIKNVMSIENLQDYLATLSISQNKLALEEIKLFPNPANKVINVVGAEIMHAKVFDLSGRMIKSSTIQNNKLDINILNSGVYIIRMTDVKGNSYQSKFIKK